MFCPFCGHSETQVIDSRVSDLGDSIRRRRQCGSPECGKRFTTYETVELRMPQVVKSNGIRAEFDVEKLRLSFLRALHKRPVATDNMDAAVSAVSQNLLTRGLREIPSRDIGEMVMNELKRLDKVAYIRFASVYRSFQDTADFSEAIREIEKPALPSTSVANFEGVKTLKSAQLKVVKLDEPDLFSTPQSAADD